MVAGDAYVWNVRGLNGTQTGPPSVNLFFQAPAPTPPPTLAAPTANGPGSTASPGPVVSTLTPTLAWTGISGVTGYSINLYNATTQTLLSYQVGASASSFTVAGGVLIAGDAYVWNVRGVNGTQTGPPSVNLYFQAPAPTTPPTLAAPTSTAPGTSASPGPVISTLTPTLAWTGVSGVTGYAINLYNATTQTLLSYQVGASASSYTVAAHVLIAGDAYVWNVRGVNGSQTGSPSVNRFFQAPAAATPPVIAAPTSTGPGTSASPGPVISTLTPTLTWTGVSGVTGYSINLYNATTQTLLSYQVGASGSSFTVAAGVLVAGDAYVWNVRGLNGTQSGPPSGYLFFQAPVAAAPPLPMTTALAPGVTSGSASVPVISNPTLSWSPVASPTPVSGYQIYLTDLTASKTFSYQCGASVTSYTPAPGTLAAGDKFVWNVRSLVGTTSGPPSAYLYFQLAASTSVSSSLSSSAASRIEHSIASNTRALTTLQAQHAAAVAALNSAKPGSKIYARLSSRLKVLDRHIASLEQRLAALNARLK